MAELTREQFLAAAGCPKVHPVTVPGMGEVFLRAMSGTERDAYEQSMFGEDKPNLIGARARLLVRCLCDKQGKRWFGDEQEHEVGNLDSTALEPLFVEAQRLNKLTAKDLQELLGN